MFNPGFFGKTPPRWFIGQVPLDQTANKTDPLGWGDRVKVRIVGYHPKEGSTLKDDDLPWAVILRPTSHGALNRMSTGVSGGEWVIGVFLDATIEKPIPLILGVLGRTDETYDIGGSEVKSQLSSQFLKTLNWYGSITPSKYMVRSTDSASKKPTIPSAKDFGLKGL